MSLLTNNGRILFTFIACLRSTFPQTSPCMLGPSSAAVWGSFFCLDLCFTNNNSLSSTTTTTGKQLLTFSLAGTRCSQKLCLIHSLTAPGGLLTLQDLSRPLSLHSCHFIQPPSQFFGSCRCPSDSKIQCIFLQRG